MARQYKTGLIITGDASGGIKAVRATEKELAQLNQRFDHGSKRARQFGADTDQAGRRLDTLRTMAVAAGGAIATAFAAQNIAGQARMIAETDALARSIGVATSTLQAWGYAGEQVGLQSDKMGDIFKDVSDKLGDFARTGGGEAADLIEQMGLNVDALLRLSPDQQLLKIGEALEGLTASEATFFLESLGDEAVRLRPLLANNAAQLREYADEARALGVAMDEGAIAGAVEADRAMRQMQGAVTGLTNQLAADLGPGLASTARSLTDLIQSAGGASAILEQMVNVGQVLATVYGARLVTSLAAKTAAVVRDTAASVAAAQAEQAATQAATRRAAAELYAEKRLLGRAMAEARATAGTDAHTAALARLGVARQRAVAASAAHTQAVNANAAAMTRATAVARGFSGALALVGGPAGAAVLAGAAIYHFREELGLVEPRVETAVERVDTLTSALNSNSRAALENARSMLEAERQLAQFNAATLAMQRAQQQQRVFDEQAQWEAVGGQAAFGMGQRSEAQERLHELEVQLTDVRNAGQAAADGIAEVDERLEEIGKNGGDDGIDRVYTASKEAAQAAKEQADALDSLRKQLDPAYAASQRLAESTALLDRGLATGALTLSEYLDLWDRAAETFIGAEEQTRDLGDTNADTAQEMSREWERFGNSVDDTFADAFRGAFDSFEDFADQLKGAFQNLLAELAYAAVKNEIKIQLGMGTSGPMQGGITGSGGLLDSLSGSNTLISKGADLLGLTSSLGVAGSAPISYATGFGAQVATGTYTGALGNATAAASTSSSGILSGISAAAPWIAGGLAVDNLLGLGIVEGITDFVSDLFGGGKSEPSLHMRTVAPQDDYRGVFENTNHEVWGDSPFGTVGFWDPGTSRLNDLFGGDFDKARQMTEAIALQDQMLAALADSEEQLAAMTEAAREFEHWGGDAQSILDGLGDRTVAIVSAIDDEWAAFAGGLEGDNQAVMERIQQAATTIELMSTAAERLNLNLGETGELSLTAADSLAQMAGGAQNFAAVQQGYYQAVFSETERLSHSQADLVAQLSSVTDTVPSTTDELRAMVEAADLSTAAGQELALGLMQLAPALAQTSQAVEKAITEAYQSELGRAPDAAGLAYWMEQISSGAITLERALQYITDATEDAAQDVASSADVLRERAGLERQLLRLQGDTAALRFRELSELNPSNRALQERIWALEDEADAARDAARIAQEASALERQLLRLQGDTSALRALELTELDPSNRALQERIWALEDEQAAADRLAQARADQQAADEEARRAAEEAAAERAKQLRAEAEAMSRARDALAGFARSITEWLDQLRATGQGLGTPQQQLTAAADAFNRQLGLAATGDRDAMGSITQYADRYLDAAKGMYASSPAMQDILASVTGAVSSLPDQLSPEQFLADEFRRSIGEQTDSLTAQMDTTSAAEVRAVDNLPGLIADTISPLFSQLDTSLDGLIDWTEFRSGFEGLASDATLRAIFDELDANGDGQISRLEAIGRSTSATEGYTQQTSDSAASTDANTAAVENNTDVNRLNDALFTPIRGYLALINETTQVVKDVLREGVDVSLSAHHDQAGTDYIGWRLAAQAAARGIGNGGIAYANGGAFVGGVQAFASGGAFTNSVVSSPTAFPMGLMGEAGPEAIMPLSRTADGSLGVLAELPPLPPLLGGGDVVEVLQDLRREVAQLRRENAQLQGEGNKHAAASVRVQQTGFQRTLAATQRGNEHLDDMARAARLEAAR